MRLQSEWGEEGEEVEGGWGVGEAMDRLEEEEGAQEGGKRGGRGRNKP